MLNIVNNKYLELKVYKDSFLAANPFPHIVLDDFLNQEHFLELKKTFDNMSRATSGKTFESDVEEKKWISLNTSLPDKIKHIVDFLNSELWVENMRQLSGINSLVSTQYGNTQLANYHEMDPGGVLGSHVDHSFEPESGIPHVLNLLVYLTEDWNVKDGGGTFLYNESGKEVIKKVEYKNNRAIIFLHTPYSFHGVERITDDCISKRRTLYVDYYSQTFDPYSEMSLNFNKNWFKHGTMFNLGSILNYLKPKNKDYLKSFLQYHVRKNISRLLGP